MASAPAYTGKQIEAALVKKGFKPANKHHRFLAFHVDGKKTAIHTKISHARKTYKGQLEHYLRQQLKVSKSELVDLVECPMSEADYLACLERKNAL